MEDKDIHVLSKTPEEIKKGLVCCIDGNIPCNSMCVYDECTFDACKYALLDDAIAYIEQLEAERDAAIADIKESDVLHECEHCAHRRMTQEEEEACERNGFECMKCAAECKCKSCRNGSNWEWRGVKEEGTCLYTKARASRLHSCAKKGN